MMPRKRLTRTVLGALVAAVLAGCASPGYYVQAISGQIEILNKRRPLAQVLHDPATDPKTRAQLELVQRLRDFASRELGLPDNDSYRTYVDLDRPFVAWNVFATRELSLEPKQWCFLFAGCVAYRGYFTRPKAEGFAAAMKRDGYDVYVGAVAAYSTLGWFGDPVLNTFIRRSESDLAGLLFHELAHQVVYVGGDTAFNESFATTVELEGVRRWFERLGTAQQIEAYREKLRRRDEFTDLVLKHRARLQALYASALSDDAKRAGKARIFAELRADYAQRRARWGGYAAFDAWFAQDLNNAHLTAIGLYHQYVAAFQKLLERNHNDLNAFYRAVRELAQLSAPERHRALRALAPDPSPGG